MNDPAERYRMAVDEASRIEWRVKTKVDPPAALEAALTELESARRAMQAGFRLARLRVDARRAGRPSDALLEALEEAGELEELERVLSRLIETSPGRQGSELRALVERHARIASALEAQGKRRS